MQALRGVAKGRGKRDIIMSVKIEMEMPKSCHKCKFFSHSYSFVFENDIDECLIEKSLIMFDPEKGRPSWCPLQEVKE